MPVDGCPRIPFLSPEIWRGLPHHSCRLKRRRSCPTTFRDPSKLRTPLAPETIRWITAQKARWRQMLRFVCVRRSFSVSKQSAANRVLLPFCTESRSVWMLVICQAPSPSCPFWYDLQGVPAAESSPGMTCSRPKSQDPRVLYQTRICRVAGSTPPAVESVRVMISARKKNRSSIRDQSSGSAAAQKSWFCAIRRSSGERHDHRHPRHRGDIHDRMGLQSWTGFWPLTLLGPMPRRD